MDLLEYRLVISETDSRIRSLERQWFQNKDSKIGLKLIQAYRQIGEKRKLIQILPELDPTDLHLLKQVEPNIEQLRNVGIAAQNLPTRIDPLSGMDVALHLLRQIALQINRDREHDPYRLTSEHRATTLTMIEPYLPLLAQDPETALGSAKLFKFIWEELVGNSAAQTAKNNLASVPTYALDYFEHYATVVNNAPRRNWPWRFGDPLGDRVLICFASTRYAAMGYATISSRLSTVPPWPANTRAGLMALRQIASDPDTLEQYLNLPNGNHILEVPAIRPIIERTRSQN